MANPKLSTLQDPFIAATINTTVWNNITAGTATLDAVNDLVVLAQPTTNGATNTFGTTTVYDATSSQIYAEVGVVANGNGGTKTAFKVALDANNSVALRAESGVFKFTMQIAGTTVVTTLPTYDPNAHGWWQLRESAGTWYADTSADGLNWTTLTSSAYSWAATAVTFVFQTGASVTEVAGNAATIQHVNTMLGGPFNINWPLLEHAWGAHWNANGGDSPLDQYVNVSARTQGQTSVRRGRQYELDQVQSGEASVVLANKDGALDPTNASGPYAGHILPYQPYRIRAQWPQTKNLLTQTQATAGTLGGQPLGAINSGNSGPSIFTNTDAAHGSFVTTPTAWRGTTTMQFAVPAGSVAPSAILYTPQACPTPGLTYTQSIWVRNITPSTTVQVYAFIRCLDVTSNNIILATGTPTTLTGSATAAWTQLTVTVTAPANTAFIRAGVFPSTAAAATCSVQADGWQVEQAGAASSWACPGIWYPMIGAFTERWPSSWNMSGTYGVVTPTCVDALSLLSQKILSDALAQEINNNSPRFVYKLDDPSASLSAADSTGNYPAALLGISKNGAGSLTFGNAITAASSTGAYTGSSGSVVTINNPSPGVNAYVAATFLSLDGAGIVGPANPSGSWTRMMAFRYTGPTPTYTAYLWSSMDNQHSTGAPNGSQLYWRIDNTGKFVIDMCGPTGTLTQFATGPTVADSNWHLVIASYSHANAQFIINIDGANASWSSFNPALEPIGLDSDKVGAFVDIQTGNYSSGNFKGDISFVAEFPSALGTTSMGNLYTAWRSACAGESTNARYARILRYSGYIGPSSVQTGLTTSMGPASIDGQDAASALQAVVDTESGEHFVARDGTVTFRSRSARYNAMTPVYTFGESTTLGEWPYEDCQLDFDSTHLSNQVTVTQASSQQAFYAQDQTAITDFFPRTMSRTVNSSSALECQDAANYLLSRYKNPATRVSAIKLHPSARPAMWAVCLSLELGMRVRVMRRAPNVPATQVECFIEQVQWDLDDSGEAFVTLQCSPADLTPYGIFAAWHTTLRTTIASGVGTITVNASADTTNPLATQLGPGQTLILGQNSANQETVTVKTVGATSAGWTSAAITLAANTTKAHTAGDLINEPLPTGVTDPTTYDASSAFDAIAFAY